MKAKYLSHVYASNSWQIKDDLLYMLCETSKVILFFIWEQAGARNNACNCNQEDTRHCSYSLSDVQIKLLDYI